MVNVPTDLSFEDDSSILFGKLLVNPAPGDEVVISGMSGCFPLADNIEEFKTNLYNKVDMISKIIPHYPKSPRGYGFLKDKSRFDAGFFGIHGRHAHIFSSMGRVLLEKCHECILDAGLHPSDLEGSNTAIYLGITFDEAEIYHYFMSDSITKDAILNERSVIVGTISKQLKLNGPCTIVDTACSSGGFALEAAFKAIRLGKCDGAIVATTHHVLSEASSLKFTHLGVLSTLGECRPFDEDGLGYVRAEATVALLLQKAKDSNRIYAKILHSKTNCDGFKEEGITYPSCTAQTNLLKEIYFESNTAPSEISYIEAHGTGTIVGDPEELKSIDEVFTPNRKSPLLVGSVKSNMGHSEASAMLCSIVKVILAFESNLIAPNINYKTPRKNLKGVLEGRIKIVTESTPFQNENGLIGVSGFGFGGGNAHAILKRNSVLKINNGKPTDDLPRLVCVSGRTEEAVNVLLEYIASKFDVELMALIYNAFRKPIKNQLYRGYVVVSKEGVLRKSVQRFVSRRHVRLHFGPLTGSSGNLLDELFSLEILVQFREKTRQYFIEKKLDIEAVIKKSQFFTNFLIQLAFAELLKELDLTVEVVLGYSVGYLASVYFQKFFTLQQVLDCALVILGYLENGKLQSLTQQKNNILSEFKQILHSSKITLRYDKPHQEAPSHEELFDAIFESVNLTKNNMKEQSLIIEVGQTTAMPRIKKNTYLNLTSATDLMQVLESLGSLYQNGQQLQIQRLYPKVNFPVSRCTPTISSAIKWKHEKKYFLPNFKYDSLKNSAKRVFIRINEKEWASLNGHVIDDKNLFPATSYIYITWAMLSEHLGMDLEKLNVTFENCRFLRACQLSRTRTLALNIMIQMSSGRFEITDNDEPVMTGYIKFYKNVTTEKIKITKGFDDNEDCLNSKDIYKELRLRGYNYKGKFKNLQKITQNADQGIIKWADDWVAFMDNMLQMQILKEDTRLLYVPISIERIIINPEAHMKEVNKVRALEVRSSKEEEEEENPPVDLYVSADHHARIIRSGGIEFKGLTASSIPRRRLKTKPVLEKYEFVPNIGKLSIELAVRVFMQIALENNCGLMVTAVEIADDTYEDDAVLIGPIINKVLSDQPLIRADVTILSTKNIEEGDVKVENKNLSEIGDATVIVGRELLNRKFVLDEAVRATQNKGFLVSREPLTVDITNANLGDLELLNAYETDKEKLLFLKKKSEKPKRESVFINVTSTTFNFEWLEVLKQEVTKKNNDVVVWCQDEPLNGLIGLLNCIRREPDCQHVRGLFIVGEAPQFNPSLTFYQNQLNKFLNVNILINCAWGTYRHFLLGEIQEATNVHCFANTTVRGDLSSIKWIEGPLSKQTEILNELIEVFYSALNFKDVMMASGRINVDIVSRDRREHKCVQGFEFSGQTLSGKRVMGSLPQGTLATLVKIDPNMLWHVPESWTLKDAATVPVVYTTCIYSLLVVGRIKRGESILIHSGTGGIGQAAINLCLSMGCTIFTTVGTEEKRCFIKKNFPEINEKHIGNSRDLNFERMIMKETNGKGVDMVLNSLVEEKLFASIRCLSKNGRFLEIGKFDLANDNRLNLLSFKQGASYHGVMLDKLFVEVDHVKTMLHDLVQKYLDSGFIKPLNTTVFDKTDLERAFRFMTTGRHIGKVLIEIRDEEKNAHPETYKGLPRYYCDPTKTYMICGGLGGFGLEFADWLVVRGCKKLVLTSRKGVTTGYQRYRINIWKNYGCTVKISTKDFTTKSGCEALVEEANALAPVKAVFNLAVVLKDAFLSNQTVEDFQISFGPKAYATQYLDEVTRISCPELRDFVVFSSVSCGRGNAGQTNYGMSNSVMERICEKRRQEGYPALAIQWGAVGDVGLVANLKEDYVDFEIGGTLPQSIASCLEVLEVILRQNEATIVSSIVVAEKSYGTSGNIIEVIGGILGIADIKLVSMHSTLAELGMDSINAVEIKQTLERDYNIILTPNELRTLTLARVKELHFEQSEEKIVDWTTVMKCILDTAEQTSNYVTLKSNIGNTESKNIPKIIAFPGIEGVCTLLEKLTESLEIRAIGINYISTQQEASFPKMAETLLPYVRKLLNPNESFHLLAHSLGSVVALEVAHQLENLGHQGKIILIDGSPAFMKRLTQQVSEGNSINFMLANTLRIELSQEETDKVMEDICKCTTLDEKMKIFVSNMKLTEKMSESFVVNGTTACLKRVQACNYTPTIGKLKSKVWLYKPNQVAMKLEDDYELGQYFENPVEIKVFDGTHTSILENEDLGKDIMRCIG